VLNPPGTRGKFSLGMTRALGHRMMSAYGVIPTPTVALRTLCPGDLCLIVASDGVWEGLDAARAVREVGDALAEGRSAHGAAAAVCKAAVNAVSAKGQLMRPDNTTAALFVFEDLA
jgi:serine/threonine protein phosphatase PrpC